MPWTKFMDAHSGGGQKESWEECYIEAPEKEAISIFFARFGHSPLRATCTCCGEDYFFYELEEGELPPCPSDRCKVIFERTILPEERKMKVPKQGYVWIK